MREARLAELTNLLERMSAMCRGGGGEGLDGVAGSGGSDSEGDDTSLMARDGEERDFGRAPPPSASLSRLLRAMENSANVSGGGGGANRRSLEELMRLEAAFFLGMDEDPVDGHMVVGTRNLMETITRGMSNSKGIHGTCSIINY